MGHSMGGGASFLACENNSEPTTMVTFAAANTNPSSIQAAANVHIPTLLFAGEFDCVTPPVQHQYPMYEATASQQKIIIDIYGGGHCYFADYNFFVPLAKLPAFPNLPLPGSSSSRPHLIS
jgi:dienelactone hydrolase